MKKHRIYLTIVASLLLLMLASTTTAQQATEVAVVVNPDNPVSSISTDELRRIFAGDKQSWSGNMPVFPVIRAPQAAERQFLLGRILKMTEQEYKQYWVRKVYSGEALHEPVAVFSNGMQLEAIRAKKGGIALISLQDVHSGVKIIKVDGYAPGSPGYPLK